jgi:hypothetical protein
MRQVGVGFHPDASVADAEIDDHQGTCRSWGKASFHGIVTAKKMRLKPLIPRMGSHPAGDCFHPARCSHSSVSA